MANRKQQFLRYPKIEKLYKKACDLAYEKRRHGKNNEKIRWVDGASMFRLWIEENEKVDEAQSVLFE